ncbi:MAG TPA: peptidoglycan editing factor PgeF [Acidobacteriaceae bacterium]|nr:peptidoglycan editing factor PgeF [Acidobacteriaceae bacterium]
MSARKKNSDSADFTGSKDSLEEALRGVDSLLAAVGLSHGTRSTRPLKKTKMKSQPALAKRSKPMPIVVRVPAWERYRWLVHGYSTRLGGVSSVYAQGTGQGELNLGFTASDTRENVLRNREIFLRELLGNEGKAAKKKLHNGEIPLALLRQIHSGIVYRMDAVELASTTRRGGDGMITNVPGSLLGILTADCLPVLVADVRQRVVAAFHAGWRGTAKRIVERGVGRMQAEFGSKPEDLTAAIGPGIGGCCYAIGDEVRNEFDSQFAYSNQLFREVYDSDPIKEKYPLLFMTARAPGHSNLGPSMHLDLEEANRRQLLDAGVSAAKIHVLGLCTACHTEHFFSHRGEQGFTGRMMGVIGIRAH